MKQIPVIVPSRKKLIQPSPGFAKKHLAGTPDNPGDHLELNALCGFGCVYCSSNSGNYMRYNRQRFDEATRKQAGMTLDQSSMKSVTLEYADVDVQLMNEINALPSNHGRGKTLIFSQLTDPFSPRLVANGTTENALKLILERTLYTVRILTKSAAVGSRRFVDLFSQYPDRVLVGCSIGTLDEEFTRRVEAGTSRPAARMRAIRNLQDARVPTYGMLCPVFPGHVNYVPDILAGLRVDQLVEVFAEPYNDRSNWRHVASAMRHNDALALDVMHREHPRRAWSRYAADLYQMMRSCVPVEKLRYLLYETDVLLDDADRLDGLSGVLLQSKSDAKTGLSKNPCIAELQRQACGFVRGPYG